MAAKTDAATPQQRTRSKELRAPKRPLNHNPAAVRQAREARGLTQRELAELTGRRHTHISEIENATRDARPELLQRIAEALDVNVELLESACPRTACSGCGYRFIAQDSNRIPLHLNGSGAFCEDPVPARVAA